MRISDVFCRLSDADGSGIDAAEQTAKHLVLLWFSLNEFDEIAIVITRIVRHGKGSDAEIAHFKRSVEFGEYPQFCRNLFGHESVAIDALMHTLRRIDRRAIGNSHRSHCLDVVGVIVCDNDGSNLGNGEPIIAHIAFESTNANAQINEYGCAT